MISVTQATPNQIPFIQPENPFPRPGLQQQAGEIENAVLGFCKTNFDNLRHLGSTAISFVMKCKEELGEEEGKSVFDNWLESDGFGPSKYVLRVAMKIATRYSDLKPRLQKIARDNVQLWGLRALDDLFSVSESFFEMMIKRGRKAHKAIKNADNALQGKLPSLSRGSFVQVAASEDHQVKGSLGTIIDKDEHGNIVVRLVESGAEVMLRHQNLSKKTLKAVNESLLEIVENLREESLQKEQRLSEYQSAATSSSIGEVLFQEERQENAAEPIAKYEQNKVQNNTAIQDKIKVAALADSSVENEALLQTIEKLRQQVEEKERLEQVIEDLRHQIEEQKLATLRSQQLEEHNQKLQQQVVDLQQALTTTSSTLLPDINNQEISIPDNAEVEAKHDAQLEKIEERRQELNEYKAAFDAFVSGDMPLVSGQVNSKLVTELVTKLKAASEKKEAVEPTLLSEPINPVQVEQLEAKLEELKTNILEASRIEQGVFCRIREMELFESNQKVRKEARTVARRLIQANPNQDQVATSSHRGFLPFRSGKV